MNLKKIGAILTIGGMVISGSYATLSYADNVAYDNEIGHGSEIITEQVTRKITSGNYDGGYWIRGKSDSNKVVSKYKHYTASKWRASTTNGTGSYHDGGCKTPDKNDNRSLSVSEKLTWTSSGVNKANYDYQK